MGSIVNGMAVHGGITKPYTATFMPFADYMRPPIRLAAIMGISPVFVFTHDSIGVGEDGPTHQPVEHLASLRAIPQMTVIRPADANETVAAWKVAMEIEGPVTLAFTRQKLPVYAPDGVMEGVARGAYIKLTGSEVSLVMDAHKELAALGIRARVVSMPSWELFERQEAGYRSHVLPPDIKARVAIEAAVPFGWHQWVGDTGIIIGLNRFGASAPYATIYKELGITTEAVVKAARRLVGK
jgi:transketolase